MYTCISIVIVLAFNDGDTKMYFMNIFLSKYRSEIKLYRNKKIII